METNDGSEFKEYRIKQVPACQIVIQPGDATKYEFTVVRVRDIFIISSTLNYSIEIPDWMAAGIAQKYPDLFAAYHDYSRLTEKYISDPDIVKFTTRSKCNPWTALAAFRAAYIASQILPQPE